MCRWPGNFASLTSPSWWGDTVLGSPIQLAGNSLGSAVV